MHAANLLNVVHGGDRSFGIGFLAVTDESKTTAAASVAVLDNDLSNQMYQHEVSNGVEMSITHSLLNGTEFLELLAQRVLIGVPGKAAEGMLARRKAEGLQRCQDRLTQ